LVLKKRFYHTFIKSTHLIPVIQLMGHTIGFRFPFWKQD
jgi:hypothetical protein